MKRPDINDIVTGEELKRWYWLKQELVDFCKQTQLNYIGGKLDILERICSDKVVSNANTNTTGR